MKMLSGYFKDDIENVVNAQYDIEINSCGRYELVKLDKFQTRRPGGREDFQLLYVAKGKATFTLNGEQHSAVEGTIVIYSPGEDQYYHYSSVTSPIIYWLHFSGFNVHKVLEENNLSNKNIFFVGIKNDLSLIFDKIIKELQRTQGKYFELCNLYIKELLTLCSRYLIESNSMTFIKNKILEEATQYFSVNFNTVIT